MTLYHEKKTPGATIRLWTRGVPVEPEAERQLANMASLGFVHPHIAVMPDVHLGKGATVGSVIPTRGAIVPAAVGVDIGCGMMATKLTLSANQLPDSLAPARAAIEQAVPVGRAQHRDVPRTVEKLWYGLLKADFEPIQQKHAAIAPKHSPAFQIGTLGGGNHFIELCLDEADGVWVMLHSGSRGIGNRIGGYFIEQARKAMAEQGIDLPDRDLAWLDEGSEAFADYVGAVDWAQRYAAENRKAMMVATLEALRTVLPPFQATPMAVNCHHNYVARERHFGETLWVTRKGAVRAGLGELGIIPGSMGARSYIVRGLGNPESFMSCSHGAGRVMSRTAAKQRISLEQHRAATQHVECRKDEGVIDESPAAYKSIDAVMAAQSDLVEIAHELRQVICVKG
ncbi:MAG TPA: RtcB family protein [Kiloniellales bacterium]|nr:RtcB family protein [Kiloniellales bacterium]